MPHDWLKKLAPHFHPIRSKTKTNRDLLARVFPRFASDTCNYYEFWLVYCNVYGFGDWLEWLLWFWFYDAQLKTALYNQSSPRRKCLVDQLPCGSVLTPVISCTKFQIHLAHADSPMAKTIFSSFFTKDQSLLHRTRNSGRECAWWTNSLVGQYLHQLSLVQSSRSI